MLRPGRSSQLRSASPAMVEPDDIHDGPLGGENAEFFAAPDRCRLAPEVEGALVELVQADGCPELRAGTAPGNGNVDHGGDRVDEVVPGQCRLKADRG